jgi:hypothetical protein
MAKTKKSMAAKSKKKEPIFSDSLLIVPLPIINFGLINKFDFSRHEMWLCYALFIEPKTEEDNHSHATNLRLSFPVEHGLSVTVKYKNSLIEAMSTKIMVFSHIQ